VFDQFRSTPQFTGRRQAPKAAVAAPVQLDVRHLLSARACPSFWNFSDTSHRHAWSHSADYLIHLKGSAGSNFAETSPARDVLASIGIFRTSELFLKSILFRSTHITAGMRAVSK
jgi:hypothetical protein